MLTENDVVKAVAAHLSMNGYRVDRQLSTTERGIDIEAVRIDTGRRLLIEAKGGTSSKDWTDRFGLPFSGGQATSHVSRAFYSAAKLLQEHASENAQVAMAFPDDKAHRARIENISSPLKSLGITVFFVDKDHKVQTVG